MADLASRTIADLAPDVRAGAVSPVEVVQAILDRIRRLEPTLRTYVTIDERAALAGAQRAALEIAAGRWRGPLHGMPIAIKDCLAVAGWPTTNASPLMAATVTDRDAVVVGRLRRAGAVIIGKNNLHEWAMGGTCTGMPAGTVRNPWDVDRVPGGSSGGSAAAVSAGLALGAVGTDGMGSVRTPASYCGVVGLKPTPGLVPRLGELPPNSSAHGTVGPIARDVRDVAILLKAISGPHLADPTSRRPPPGWRLDPDGLRPEIQGLRVGLPRGYFLDEATPAVVASLEATVATLVSLGAIIREVELPSLRQIALTALGMQSETQSFLFRLAVGQPEGFASRDIRFRILANEFVRLSDAQRALRLRDRIRVEVAATMHDLDLLLTPTNSTPAFPIGAEQVRIGTADQVVHLSDRGGQARLTTRLTLPFNIVGLPAISLPARELAGGLPIGVQLVAHEWHEPMLLRAALALEGATSGGFREPPMARDAISEEASETEPVGSVRAIK